MLGASPVHPCNNDYITMSGMDDQSAVRCRWLTPVMPKTFSCGYTKTHSVRQMDELTFSMLQVVAFTSSRLLLLLCNMGSKS